VFLQLVGTTPLLSTKIWLLPLYVYTGQPLLPSIRGSRMVLPFLSVFLHFISFFPFSDLPFRSLLPAWSLPAVLQALSSEPFEPLFRASFRHLTL